MLRNCFHQFLTIVRLLYLLLKTLLLIHIFNKNLVNKEIVEDKKINFIIKTQFFPVKVTYL